MNIYFIKCQIQWPVGEAGAVIVANNPEEALAYLPSDCQKPSEPELIGLASEKYKSPEIIFYNSTEY